MANKSISVTFDGTTFEVEYTPALEPLVRAKYAIPDEEEIDPNYIEVYIEYELRLALSKEMS